jgi:two-component system nitrate/nitrite response regulator NarL
MPHLFLTGAKVPPPRWREAFPDALVGASTVGKKPAATDIVWLHASDAASTASKVAAVISRFAGCRVVVLSNIPSDDEAMAALGAGAQGYCNAYAAPEVLREVAEVARRGGLWVGETLLSRLLSGLSQRFLADRPAEVANGPLTRLSAREREIARRVAHGESNKEIARGLKIAERTVKAHLTVVFEKLGVRDRLQLALACSTLK